MPLGQLEEHFEASSNDEACHALHRAKMAFVRAYRMPRGRPNKWTIAVTIAPSCSGVDRANCLARRKCRSARRSFIMRKWFGTQVHAAVQYENILKMQKHQWTLR